MLWLSLVHESLGMCPSGVWKSNPGKWDPFVLWTQQSLTREWELTLILQQLNKQFVLRGNICFRLSEQEKQEQQNIFLGGLIKMSLVGKCKWKIAQFPSLPSFYSERENRILMKTSVMQLFKTHTWHELTFRDFFSLMITYSTILKF